MEVRIPINSVHLYLSLLVLPTFDPLSLKQEQNIMVMFCNCPRWLAHLFADASALLWFLEYFWVFCPFSVQNSSFTFCSKCFYIFPFTLFLLYRLAFKILLSQILLTLIRDFCPSYIFLKPHLSLVWSIFGLCIKIKIERKPFINHSLEWFSWHLWVCRSLSVNIHVYFSV